MKRSRRSTFTSVSSWPCSATSWERSRAGAAALSALDAIGVTAVGEITAEVSSAYKQASLAYEIGRRVPDLVPGAAPADDLVTDLYARLGREQPPPGNAEARCRARTHRPCSHLLSRRGPRPSSKGSRSGWRRPSGRA